MSTRLNQEVFEVAVPELSSSGGNTRLNQEAILLGVNANAYPGNVRLNQLAFLVLAPAVLQGAKVQIVGGPFQDALGNPLSNGYLLFKLQHDAVALNTGQIVGDLAIRVPLDINGYIQGTVTGSPVYIWPNNVLLPAGGTYSVWAYTSTNQLAWDNTQAWTIASSPSPFNVNAIVPGP